MTEQALNIILIISILLLIDLYVLHGIRGAFIKWKLPQTGGFTFFLLVSIHFFNNDFAMRGLS